MDRVDWVNMRVNMIHCLSLQKEDLPTKKPDDSPPPDDDQGGSSGVVNNDSEVGSSILTVHCTR